MVLNNCQWPSEKVTPKKPSGVHELDVFNNLAVQVLLLTKKLQSSQLQNAQVVANVRNRVEFMSWMCSTIWRCKFRYLQRNFNPVNYKMLKLWKM